MPKFHIMQLFDEFNFRHSIIYLFLAFGQIIVFNHIITEVVGIEHRGQNVE